MNNTEAREERLPTRPTLSPGSSRRFVLFFCFFYLLPTSHHFEKKLSRSRPPGTRLPSRLFRGLKVITLKKRTIKKILKLHAVGNHFIHIRKLRSSGHYLENLKNCNKSRSHRACFCTTWMAFILTLSPTRLAKTEDLLD